MFELSHNEQQRSRTTRERELWGSHCSSRPQPIAEMNEREKAALIALQQALLGEVSDRLRAVLLSTEESSVHFEAFFHGEITGDDRESMSMVETELIASFPSSYTITYSLTRLDYPGPIPKEATWAYYRKE